MEHHMVGQPMMAPQMTISGGQHSMMMTHPGSVVGGSVYGGAPMTISGGSVVHGGSVMAGGSVGYGGSVNYGGQ